MSARSPQSTQSTQRPQSLWILRHARRRDFDDPGWAATAPRPHDPPLSEAGRAQAAALARSLETEGIHRLFASPFLRCVETAAPLAERLALPIRIEPGLSEWLNREWFAEPPELLPPQERLCRFPRIDPHYRPRGGARYGESGTEALARSGVVARRLVAETGGSLALVGHGASVRGALAALLEVDPAEAPELGYAAAARLRRRGAGWRLAELRGSPPADSAAGSSPADR